MLNSKLFFIKNEWGFYSPPSIPNEDLILEIISILFTDGTGVDLLQKMLLNENRKGNILGNRYRIDFIGGDILRIGDQFDDEEEFYVNFSKKTLLKLLDQWQDLVAKNTQEIVFYRNGDDYGMVDAQDFHEA